MSHDITVLTVAGPGDEPFIRSNIELSRKLNPNADIEFVVIDNGITGPQGIGIEGDLDAEVIQGVPQSNDKPASCRGSYQHSEALNGYLQSTKPNSRYLLILDPDFYIVTTNWVNMVTTHMKDLGLAFFGAPWHPKWYSKYRNFPCVHCMFVDCNQIDITELDFAPALVSRNEAVERRKGKKQAIFNRGKRAIVDAEAPIMHHITQRWWRLLGHMFVMSTHALAQGYRESGTPLPWSFKLLLRISRKVNRLGRLQRQFKSLLGGLASLTINRRFINISNDTGFQVFRRYSRSTLGIELVQPVVDYHDAFVAVKHLRFRVGRIVESLLPDRWRYVPKRPGYFTDHGFRHFGFPDLTRHHWEEFIWHGAPFGYHLRRFNKAKRDVELELQQIQDVTTHIVSKAALKQGKV